MQSGKFWPHSLPDWAEFDRHQEWFHLDVHFIRIFRLGNAWVRMSKEAIMLVERLLSGSIPYEFVRRQDNSTLPWFYVYRKQP